MSETSIIIIVSASMIILALLYISFSGARPRKGSGKVRLQCSSCGKYIDIKMSDLRMRKGEMAKCPYCRSNTREIRRKSDAEIVFQDMRLLRDTARRGDTEKIRQIIETSPELCDMELEDGQRPLHVAAMKGQDRTAELILSYGADVNSRDKYGQTPLHYAVQTDHLNMVELLISHGADVNRKDFFGNSPLIYAARRGCSKTAEFLVNRGAHVDEKSIAGGTPLYWAAVKGHSEIVKYLISRGADVNVTDYEGNTPLKLAEKSKNADLIKLIREHRKE